MLVVAMIAILCAAVVPNVSRARILGYRAKCIINMRKIAMAKEHWSLEVDADDTDTPTAAQLDPYLEDGTSAIVCSEDPNSSFATSYNINDMSTNPACKVDGAHVFAKEDISDVKMAKAQK